MRVLGALILGAVLGLAGAARADDIAVAQGWARATPGAGKTAVVYFTIANKGSQPDRLLSLSTPVADSAVLHETRMEGGVMKMRPLGPVTVDAGQTLHLKPSGDHLMLEGLTHPLKEGEQFPVTLVFEKAGTKQVSVAVGKVGAMGPPAAASMDHHDTHAAH
jgi:copper(I)-binding protein